MSDLTAARRDRAAELDAAAELVGTLDALALVPRTPGLSGRVRRPLATFKMASLHRRQELLQRELRAVERQIRDVERRRAAFDQHFDVVGDR